MAFVNQDPAVLQRPASDKMSLWQLPFATAGAFIDCLTCQMPARDFNPEQQLRMENRLRMYPPANAVASKAVFTATPLQDEAIRQGLIHVPKGQAYSHTNMPPLGASQQLVSVRQHEHTFNPMPIYSGSFQYLQEPSSLDISGVYYPNRPTACSVTQQPTENPLMTPPGMMYPMPGSELGYSTGSPPSAVGSMQTWQYVLRDRPVAPTATFVLSDSKGVQVDFAQRHAESAIGAESKESGARPEGEVSLLLVSTNHSESLYEEEGFEQKRDDAATQSELSVKDDEAAEAKAIDASTKSGDAKESKEDAADVEDMTPCDAARKSASGEKTVLAGTDFAQLESTAAESTIATHSNFQGTLESTSGEKLSDWPVGYVPPPDPQDYKELRIGSNVYLIGGTFYLSETGAYLLGLRN